MGELVTALPGFYAVEHFERDGMSMWLFSPDAIRASLRRRGIPEGGACSCGRAFDPEALTYWIVAGPGYRERDKCACRVPLNRSVMNRLEFFRRDRFGSEAEARAEFASRKLDRLLWLCICEHPVIRHRGEAHLRCEAEACPCEAFR